LHNGNRGSTFYAEKGGGSIDDPKPLDFFSTDDRQQHPLQPPAPHNSNISTFLCTDWPWIIGFIGLASLVQPCHFQAGTKQRWPL
jgi:hypothetical protein